METTKIKVRSRSIKTRIPVNGTIYYKCDECQDTGYVVINPGCCGGCEICGNLEEKKVRCPFCNSHDE